MRAPAIVFLAFLSGCAGPEASDAAVCADYIQRICTPPPCEAVVEALQPEGDCQAALLEATGCSDPNFTFTTPSRERFLQCRAVLLRDGDRVGQRPACEDVEESLTGCPDVVEFLQGALP